MIQHPNNNHFYIVESDNRVMDDASLQALEQESVMRIY
jgi:hypothetical protein